MSPMFSIRSCMCLLAAIAVLCNSVPALAQDGQPADKGQPKQEPVKKLTSAEQIQEALAKNVTIDYIGQSMNEVLLHVTKKTGVPFALDMNAAHGHFNQVMAMPMGGFGFAGGGGPGFPGMPGFQTSLKIQNAPLGKGIKQFLQKQNLSYAVVGNRVLITGEQQALVLQMKQLVEVDVAKTAMNKALQDLAKKNGATLLIDPAASKDAEAEVSLKLDSVSLETAVRLLAFAGGMKAVRVDNVLVVTSPTRAALLPAETPYPSLPPSAPMDIDENNAGPGFPGGIPGAPGQPVPPGVDPAVPMRVPDVNPNGVVDPQGN